MRRICSSDLDQGTWDDEEEKAGNWGVTVYIFQDLATEPGIDFGDHAKSDQVEVLVICVPVLFVGEIEDDAIM
jgi:hypothetical protein